MRSTLWLEQPRGVLDVVAEPVVGRVRERRDHRLAALVLDQRALLELLADHRGLELGRRDRADHAARVAPRAQIDRNGAAHVQRVVQGLVAVAVDQRDVAVGDGRAQDDLVAGRAAADHEEGLVGAEDARGVALRLADRAGVVVQRPELPHRDRQVRAQHLLAVEAEEGAADRRLHERGTAGVTRRVPRVRVGVGEVHEPAEERRQDRVQVAARGRVDAPRDERRAVLGHPDVALDLLDDLERHLTGRRAARAEQDGKLRCARAQVLRGCAGSARARRRSRTPGPTPAPGTTARRARRPRPRRRRASEPRRPGARAPRARRRSRSRCAPPRTSHRRRAPTMRTGKPEASAAGIGVACGDIRRPPSRRA